MSIPSPLLEPAREEWVSMRSRCRHASDGYATADNELWSRDGRLLLCATQVRYPRLEAFDE